MKTGGLGWRSACPDRPGMRGAVSAKNGGIESMRGRRAFKLYLWTCAECGRENAIGRLTCATCRSPQSKEQTPPASAPLKYGNRWTEYAGIRFQSKREADYCAELDFLKRAGQLVDYRRQIPIVLTVRGVKICKLVVDFELTHRDGSIELVEVKGVETPAFKLKWRLFDALYPGTRKTIVR